MLAIYSNLPSMEHTFQLDISGNATGTQYLGNFTFVRPTIGARSEIAKLCAKLGGEYALTIDEDTKNMHYTLAWLRHTLTNYPSWWKDSDFGVGIYDSNVISELLKETLKFDNQWAKDLKEVATTQIANG